ncbi:hypothetical protein L1N85_21805 [Paenibacillus alkaliterrae]|uniref:hypothetical protein n=1 Tax=Paenibacillus alkaliterrae TaxID=320909 RepID=UPI001F491153|nr:hypothetical protein [Paenibacillus alkaliterrae]MCF2941026.1 hypothetical protein [Paenibacillus alkaliterrae]
MKIPFIIAIAAVSGGGKTSVVQLLNKELANSTALFFDDYDFEGPDNLIEWVHRGADHNEWKLTPLINDIRIMAACCPKSPINGRCIRTRASASLSC